MLRKTSFACLPVDVGEKGLDIFAAFGGLVIHDKGMFPYIQDHDRQTIDEMAVLMIIDLTIGDLSTREVIVRNRPSHAAYVTNGKEICLPFLKPAIDVAERIVKFAVSDVDWLARHVIEVILMQPHAVVLEAETPHEFSISWIAAGRFFAPRRSASRSFSKLTFLT